MISDDHLPLTLLDDYNLCGAPEFSPSLEHTFLLWKECNGGLWHIRATAGGTFGEFNGEISASSEFLSIEPFQFSEADYLTLSFPNRADFQMRVWGNDQTGIDFQLLTESDLGLQVNPDQNATVQLGRAKFDATGNLWPKNVASPMSCGQPAFDAATESGVFIWRDCSTGTWHLRATAGGDYALFEGKVVSDLPLISLTAFNLNGNDRLTSVDSRQIDFLIQMWGSNINGFDFMPASGANVRLDIDTHRLPKGLTLDTNSGAIKGVPERLVQRKVRITAKDQSQRKIDGEPQAFSIDMNFNVGEP